MGIRNVVGHTLVAPEHFVAGRFDRSLLEAHVLEHSVAVRGDGHETASLVEPVGFAPIGIGKPLSIELRHVYTGRHPKRSWFDSDKDLLVTSAMRGIGTYEAAPRALNILRQDVTARTDIRDPQATREGTPLIFYTPALTELHSVLDLELVFDEFPKGLFDVLGETAGKAASIRIFMPASGYLVAAGELLKLAGKVGEALFEGKPRFKQTVALTLDRPGDIPASADFRLVMEDAHLEEIEAEYMVDATGKLVSRETRAPYRGDHPYVVIMLDGPKREEYEGFAPTAVTVATLERFYGKGERFSQSLEALTGALQLHSDWQLRARAERLAERIKASAEGTPEREALEARYEALCVNISEKLLRPPAIE